jgi:hypothetical protein
MCDSFHEEIFVLFVKIMVILRVEETHARNLPNKYVEEI